MSQATLGTGFIDLQVRGDLAAQLAGQRSALEALGKSDQARTKNGQDLLTQAMAYQKIREQGAASMAAEIDQLRARQQLLQTPAYQKQMQQHAGLQQQVAQAQAAIMAPATRQSPQQENDEQARQMRVQIDLAKQKAKWMASPEGVRMLQQQARAQKEFTNAQRELDWHQQVGAQGVLGASLDRLNADFARVGQTATVAFATGTAGLMGMIAAASPSHYATFTGSMELLASAIGSSLLPYVDQLSTTLQSARTHWLGLTEVQRGFYARLAVGAVALAGGIAGIYGVISALTGLKNMLLEIGKFAAARMGLMFSPMGQAIAGLVVVTTALAAAWYLVSSNARGAAHEIDETGRRKPKKDEKAATAVTAEQVASLGDRRDAFARAAGNVAEQGRILAAAEKEAQQRLDQARQQNIGLTPEQMSAVQLAAQKGSTYTEKAKAMKEAGMTGTVEEIEASLREKTKAAGLGHLRDFGLSRNQVREMVTERQTTRVLPAETDLENIRNITRNLNLNPGGPGGAGGPDLQALQMPMQTRFQDYSAYGQSLQEAAFKNDDIQTQLLRDHLAAVHGSNQLLTRLEEFSRIQAEASRRLMRGL